MSISVLGVNIKKIRNEKNISIDELSRLSNISAFTISQIENGKRQTLNNEAIEKIAVALDTSIAGIMGNDEVLSFDVSEITDILNIISYSDFIKLDNKVLTSKEKKLIEIGISTIINSIRFNRIYGKE